MELAAWRDAGLTQDDLKSLEGAGVTNVAMRAVGLSPKGLRLAQAMLDQLREMEGLQEAPLERPNDRDTAGPDGVTASKSPR
ncbi:hypothetical protein [Streptomyces sp. PSAA01]|uniref:hypothetical protein n=1 Tax=Streptomyces sp. PSAA01 TaxID=2912762 RepID=UPI001F16D807|nr:hypothetical protein [Streptomyces sp. PSAA01]MCG0283829.1 hypothetical protein [Streptomyces sp. PSAA01]